MIPTTERKKCVVCRGTNLEELISLPKLPLTGLYVPRETPTRYDLCADTSFVFCHDCGQGQLAKIVDPSAQYGEQYWFRSSTSQTAKAGIDFFVHFFGKLTHGIQFNSLLELGCNDLYLLNKIRHCAKECIGVDPIWKGKEYSDGNLAVLSKLNGTEKPDIIISEHTFEHLVDPTAMLSQLIEQAADSAHFFLEIPSLEYLVEHGRFDQVFHQHLNYFSLDSLRYQIQALGCRYLTHTYNPGYWGSLIIVFEKATPEPTDRAEILHFSQVRRRYQDFLASIQRLGEAIDQSPKPIYGYGAAQIAPMLAYHLKTDFKELEAFIDEDPRKIGLKFANLVPEIRAVPEDLSKSSLLLTAMDYAELLVPKLEELTSHSHGLDLLNI